MRAVLATANPGKLREMRALLAPAGIEVESQSAFGVTSADETGDTFEANALLKARHAARATGLPAIADDSGIEVDALGGRPGVYSARYAGEGASDDANLQLMLRELDGVETARRTARYRCVIAFVNSATDESPILARGAWEGRITLAPRGSGGFGYDPIFELPDLGRTVAEIDAALKHSLSHRGQAMRALLAALAENSTERP